MVKNPEFQEPNQPQDPQGQPNDPNGQPQGDPGQNDPQPRDQPKPQEQTG